MAERMTVAAALAAIELDLARAKRKHPGEFHGRHEGFAVLLEEVDELKEVVWKDGSDEDLRNEAVQVGAMALRILTELCAERSTIEPRNPCCGNRGAVGEGDTEYCATCGAALGHRGFQAGAPR